MKNFLTFSLLILISMFSFSEDIELYISESVKTAGNKTQVLVIFDNSGSMTKTQYVNEDYDPEKTYDAIGSDNSLNERFVYFTKGGTDGGGLPVPDKNNESRRFLTEINSCETARKILAETGFYTGHIREYSLKGSTGSWNELPDNNGANIEIIDCEDDVINEDPKNIDGLLPGYPVDFQGDKKNPIYHTESVSGSNVNWSGQLVTLYTDNYLRWHHGESVAQTLKSRMDIAKDSIGKVIKAAPSIDFGLQVFNLNNGDGNNSANGGRIVFGIDDMTEANETKLLDLVTNDLVGNGWTPLCETLYEASLYFSGKSIDYADDDKNSGSYHKNTPPRDKTIEDSSKYISPFSSCSSKAYVILITDGQPTYDNHANTKIEALTTVENGKTINFSGSKFNSNYLAGLAEWMVNRDLNSDIDGKQTVELYTIGFSKGADSAEPLLQEAALLGGGKYYKAEDSVQLTAALLNVLENLEPSNDSLTSASVASNNFDRTETLDSVYYAMFQPANGPRWQGNLKKYKVVNGKQVGKHQKLAIDPDTGHFSENVTSYWSADNSEDGNSVAEGGVAEKLRTKTNRVIYSDIGAGGKLALLTQDLAETSFGGKEALAAQIGSSETEVAAYLDWAKGINVDNEKLEDGTVPVMRPDVFGDPLHSKPLVVNYGDSIRILIGTNAGALHMFEDSKENDSVDETWAFMPKEFFGNILPLRKNFPNSRKIYGVDGAITSYINDKDGDGVIETGDEVWIFFGLRRGGTSYYALDISDPDKPSKLWHIDSSTPKFDQLGQSWSQPKVGYSKLNISGSDSNKKAEPVVFFGGGYDTLKDVTSVGGDDNVGKAIYMVDAKSGALKWSMAPTGGTTAYPGTDSIPSSIGILDSDSDGLVDRLYTGDTGGNIWRVDMPSAAPNDSENPWTVFKLASLGGTVDVDDIRFFNEPSIVRTFISETIQTQVLDEDGNVVKDEDGADVTIISHHEKPYDAILLGSGDRSNPIGTDTHDTFFMIKDSNIKTQSFYGSGSSKTPLAPNAILKSGTGKAGLYDYTSDPFSTATTTQQREALSLQVSKNSGWFIDLSPTGEKNTAEAIVINGVAYFTTFIPPSLGQSTVHCVLPNGNGLLYAVDLSLGTAIFNWNNSETDGIPDEPERSVEISEQFLGAPTLIVVPDDDGDDSTIDKSIGNIIVGRKVMPVGFSLQTMRTYLYVGEE